MNIISKYFLHNSPQQNRQFAAMEGLYKEWNEKINVISRKDIEGLYEKHVLHSLSIAAAFTFEDGVQVVDLGCGGGFPGIPLAVMFPKVHFHLVDSIAKKLKVAEAVAGQLALKNVSIQHTRIEEIKNKKFDFVVSRAVAPLKDLWKWSSPLIRATRLPQKPLGKRNESAPTLFRTLAPGLICLKGGNLQQEILVSGTKPQITAISNFFEEQFFLEKYLVYIKK